MAGEDPGAVWRGFCYEKGDLRMDWTGQNRYGTTCHASGCHRCTNPGCHYSGFIRRYWNHPVCD